MCRIETKILQVFKRGSENAKDESTSIDAVQEFLASHKEVDVLCLIQVKQFLNVEQNKLNT